MSNQIPESVQSTDADQTVTAVVVEKVNVSLFVMVLTAEQTLHLSFIKQPRLRKWPFVDAKFQALSLYVMAAIINERFLFSLNPFSNKIITKSQIRKINQAYS